MALLKQSKASVHRERERGMRGDDGGGEEGWKTTLLEGSDEY